MTFAHKLFAVVAAINWLCSVLDAIAAERPADRSLALRMCSLWAIVFVLLVDR